MNIKTTTLRLNIEKSDHSKAYEILKNSELSYTKYIVSAILAFAENEKIQKLLLDGIREIVKSEICGALQNCSFVQTSSYAEIKKLKNCETSETSKKEKSENAQAAVFEETVIFPYDENEENDKHIDTVFLDE